MSRHVRPTRHVNPLNSHPQANVLIDEDGHVRLSDYGLAPINSNIDLTAAESAAGNTVWLAPEIVKGGKVLESKPADIFAFAMLALELFTGKPPFEEQGRTKATNRMCNGGRPQFPQNAETIGLTVQIQKLLEGCWCQDPEERLTIDEVVDTLEGFPRGDELVPGTPNGEPALDEDYPLVDTQPTLDEDYPLVDPQPTLDEDYPLVDPQPTGLGKHPSASSSTDIANLPT